MYTITTSTDSEYSTTYLVCTYSVSYNLLVSTVERSYSELLYNKFLDTV